VIAVGNRHLTVNSDRKLQPRPMSRLSMLLSRLASGRRFEAEVVRTRHRKMPVVAHLNELICTLPVSGLRQSLDGGAAVVERNELRNPNPYERARRDACGW
jgi:hypothetical protein